MESKMYMIGIAGILDTWDPEMDIEDYRVGSDESLEIDYFIDERMTDRIDAQRIAGWFGGRFVRWEYDEKSSLDGMVIEKEVAA